MSERGQRTTLRFGGVSAEVSLLNTSGKPKAAEHETKRVLLDSRPVSEPPIIEPASAAAERAVEATFDGFREQFGEPDPLQDPSHLGHPDTTYGGTPPEVLGHDHHFASDVGAGPVDALARAGGTDPLGDGAALPPEPAPGAAPGGPVPSPATSAGLERRRRLDEEAAREGRGLAELDAIRAEHGDTVPGHAVAPDQQEYVPPATTVQQGVHLPDGTWVDLTKQLQEADERTKVEGLEVVAAIDTTSIPRERVRDAKYVAGVNPDEYGVLALLWRALRQTRRAAAVRYTKRTAQTLGIIVARGGGNDRREVAKPPHLILLELEWAENMRPPGPRVFGPITREVDEAEVAAAVELVEAFSAGPSAVNDLRDERLAARARLLELAKAGQLDEYEPPAEPMPPMENLGVDVAGVLAESASWLREHATT